MNWLKEKGEKVLGVIRKAEDIFCDAVDYLRYDQGLIATALRAADTIICTVASPVMVLVGGVAKASYYGTGYLLGQTKEQMDKSLEIITDAIGNQVDKAMNFLADKGFNVRFIGDLGATVLHVMEYIQIGKLSKIGLKKVHGIYNEGALRYKNKLIKKAEKIKNQKIKKINESLKHQQKKNTKKYRQNRDMARARKNAIKEDFKKQKEEIKKIKVLKDPNFRKKLLGMIKDGINDIIGYLSRLSYNGLWLLKEYFNNYLYNALGKMGIYGFHICPYGCGRPIPDAFRGCTELLQAFPDYFNK